MQVTMKSVQIINTRYVFLYSTLYIKLFSKMCVYFSGSSQLWEHSHKL